MNLQRLIITVLSIVILLFVMALITSRLYHPNPYQANDFTADDKICFEHSDCKLLPLDECRYIAVNKDLRIGLIKEWILPLRGPICIGGKDYEAVCRNNQCRLEDNSVKRALLDLIEKHDKPISIPLNEYIGYVNEPLEVTIYVQNPNRSISNYDLQVYCLESNSIHCNKNITASFVTSQEEISTYEVIIPPLEIGTHLWGFVVTGNNVTYSKSVFLTIKD